MKIKLDLTGDTNLKSTFEVVKKLQDIFISISKLNIIEVEEVK